MASSSSQQLIPGLPNDLSLLCLLRLPATDLCRAQKVSSLWKIAIRSDRFYAERRLRRPFASVFSILRVPHGYECLDADFEDVQDPRLLFSCDRDRGRLLFPPGAVFASVDSSAYSLAPGHRVQRFSLLTRRWTQLSKRFPPSARLMVATVGRHVVAIVCRRQKDAGSDSDDANNDADVGSESTELASSGCEILDTHTNLWTACAEGLPEEFYGRGCFTHQGTVFIKAESGTVPPAVYKLNMTEKRWAIDAHTSAALSPLQEFHRIFFPASSSHSSALCMTRTPPKVSLWSLDLVTGGLTNVLSLTMPLQRNHFLFQRDGQIFFTVQGEAWKVENVFYYHGLKKLYIPGNPLMVDAIPGGQAIR